MRRGVEVDDLVCRSGVGRWEFLARPWRARPRTGGGRRRAEVLTGRIHDDVDGVAVLLPPDGVSLNARPFGGSTAYTIVVGEPPVVTYVASNVAASPDFILFVNASMVALLAVNSVRDLAGRLDDAAPGQAEAGHHEGHGDDPGRAATGKSGGGSVGVGVIACLALPCSQVPNAITFELSPTQALVPLATNESYPPESPIRRTAPMNLSVRGSMLPTPPGMEESGA